MKHKTLIFLAPFSIKHPTLDEQNSFMAREMTNEITCAELGHIYTNEHLHGKDIPAFMAEAVGQHCPEWIVAEGECATAALGMTHVKKVLINPKVTPNDLDNVPELVLHNTFGFFDDRHEQDYERFQSVYPHAAWFPEDDDLTLFSIKETVEYIIKTEKG